MSSTFLSSKIHANNSVLNYEGTYGTKNYFMYVSNLAIQYGSIQAPISRT